MLFKRTALFFLTLASAILLLHSIVPHSHGHLDAAKHSHIHHDHGLNDAHHHHDANTPSEKHHDEKGELADVLSNFNHHAEGVTFLTSHKFNIAIERLFFDTAFLIPDFFSLSEFIIVPMLHFHPMQFFEYVAFYPCTNTLRGPPSIA